MFSLRVIHIILHNYAVEICPPVFLNSLARDRATRAGPLQHVSSAPALPSSNCGKERPYLQKTCPQGTRIPFGRGRIMTHPVIHFASRDMVGVRGSLGKTSAWEIIFR